MANVCNLFIKNISEVRFIRRVVICVARVTHTISRRIGRTVGSRAFVIRKLISIQIISVAALSPCFFSRIDGNREIF